MLHSILLQKEYKLITGDAAALFETITSDKPSDANKCRKFLIVSG